jgi:hypothetical protein
MPCGHVGSYKGGTSGQRERQARQARAAQGSLGVEYTTRLFDGDRAGTGSQTVGKWVLEREERGDSEQLAGHVRSCAIEAFTMTSMVQGTFDCRLSRSFL